MKKVLFYNSSVSKTVTVEAVLKRAFAGTGFAVEEVRAENFREKMTEDTAIFVLTGAKSSPLYREQLQGPNFTHLQKRINGGMQVLAICAGANVLSRIFSYHVYDDARRRTYEGDKENFQSEIGLVDVKAYGPDLRLYPEVPLSPGINNPWGMYAATPVVFTFDGTEKVCHLALSRGPSFVSLGQQCTPFATYRATDEAAIVRFSGGFLTGPAVEVGGAQEVRTGLAPRNHEELDIVNALVNSDPEWRRLWVGMLEDMLPKMPDVHRQIRANMGVEQKPFISPLPVPRAKMPTLF